MAKDGKELQEKNLKIEWIPTKSIQDNPKNYRNISQEDLDKLVASMREKPDYFQYMPLKVTSDLVMLGGHMRLKAAKIIGLKNVPVLNMGEVSEADRREFAIKDNTNFGQYDWAKIQEEYSFAELDHWGTKTPMSMRVDKMQDGEEIEIEKSVQIEPPKEYILIVADPNSVEWEELKEKLKLKKVRRGGYKKGSDFDSLGLERVLEVKDFTKRWK